MRIKTRRSKTSLKFIKGIEEVDEPTTLTVKYPLGQRRQTFTLLPGALRPVILGRDFTIPEDISLLLGRGGYCRGTDPNTYTPFISFPEVRNRSIRISQLPKVPLSEEISDSDEDAIIDQTLSAKIVYLPGHTLIVQMIPSTKRAKVSRRKA